MEIGQDFEYFFFYVYIFDTIDFSFRNITLKQLNTINSIKNRSILMTY